MTGRFRSAIRGLTSPARLCFSASGARECPEDWAISGCHQGIDIPRSPVFLGESCQVVFKVPQNGIDRALLNVVRGTPRKPAISFVFCDGDLNIGGESPEKNLQRLRNIPIA